MGEGSKNPSLENVGICVKSQDATVQFQNKTCLDICGHQLDKKCEKGCMLKYSKGATDPLFDQGLQLLKNINTDGHLVDAMMINDGVSLTTYFYDRTDELKKQLEYTKQFHLSKSELKVMEKFLLGFNNHEIAEQLFISKATLKTHINNIYKKLPEALKKKILSTRH